MHDCDSEIHVILSDFAIFDGHLLVLHRGAFDVFQRFRGTLDPVLDGIIKALFG